MSLIENSGRQTHTNTHKHTPSHTHQHTHIRSNSLSLSHTHTYAHSHTQHTTSASRAQGGGWSGWMLTIFSARIHIYENRFSAHTPAPLHVYTYLSEHILCTFTCSSEYGWVRETGGCPTGVCRWYSSDPGVRTAVDWVCGNIYLHLYPYPIYMCIYKCIRVCMYMYRLELRLSGFAVIKIFVSICISYNVYMYIYIMYVYKYIGQNRGNWVCGNICLYLYPYPEYMYSGGCIHLFLYLYPCTHICMDTDTKIHVYTRVYICIHILNTCVHLYTNVYMYGCICIG